MLLKINSINQTCVFVSETDNMRTSQLLEDRSDSLADQQGTQASILEALLWKWPPTHPKQPPNPPTPRTHPTPSLAPGTLVVHFKGKPPIKRRKESPQDATQHHVKKRTRPAAWLSATRRWWRYSKLPSKERSKPQLRANSLALAL